MPKIEQQKGAVNGKAAPARPAGSILSQAIDVGDLEEEFIKMVIYGQNRVGKTTLACTFPKPLLLISLEPNMTGGAMSVRKVPGVKYVRLTSTAESFKLAEELQSDRTFKTHVIDSATSFQDIILQEILGLTSVPEMLKFKEVSTGQYRTRSEKLREALRPFTNLRAHTVILAKEKDHNPPKGEEVWEGYGPRKLHARDDMRPESYFAADVGTATAGWLHDNCDYIGRLYLAKEVKTETFTTKVMGKEQKRTAEVETGKIVHRLRTLYHPNYAAGIRTDSPEKVPEYIEDPTFAKLLKVIKGE